MGSTSRTSKVRSTRKRALEIAAAGHHNVLMIGPPRSGKSMLARRLPSVLPPLTRTEALEITQVYSVAGRLGPGQGLARARPFRAPRHTISGAGLVGGGARPRPGEVSLTHHGVLFLDELPEFHRHVLDALRQPMEDGTTHLSRPSGARLSRALHARRCNEPVSCGFHGTGAARCICTEPQIRRYRSRLAAPLLDRIDLHIKVGPLNQQELVGEATAEPSAAIRERVLVARAHQRARFQRHPNVFANAHMSPRDIRRYCRIDTAAELLLRSAIAKLGLSDRAYQRVLRVARTIADLAGTPTSHPPTSPKRSSTARSTAVASTILDRDPCRATAGTPMTEWLGAASDVAPLWTTEAAGSDPGAAGFHGAAAARRRIPHSNRDHDCAVKAVDRNRR